MMMLQKREVENLKMLNNLNQVKPNSNKPAHLITLIDSSKLKFEYFLCLDKPDFFYNHLQVKGFVCKSSEKEIHKNYNKLLLDSKDILEDVMIPLHRVYLVKNLIFNSQKQVTALK